MANEGEQLAAFQDLVIKSDDEDDVDGERNLDEVNDDDDDDELMNPFLLPEIVEMLLKNLPVVEIAKGREVCSIWNEEAPRAIVKKSDQDFNLRPIVLNRQKKVDSFLESFENSSSQFLYFRNGFEFDIKMNLLAKIPNEFFTLFKPKTLVLRVFSGKARENFDTNGNFAVNLEYLIPDNFGQMTRGHLKHLVLRVSLGKTVDFDLMGNRFDGVIYPEFPGTGFIGSRCEIDGHEVVLTYHNRS